MPERVAELAAEVAAVTKSKLSAIESVAMATKMLAINASVEAASAGPSGAGFGIVAREVEAVAETVKKLSRDLNEELTPLVGQLTELGETLVEQVRGARLADLARNVVELIDRNLYERSCDVRWWATDSAVVDACEQDAPAARSHASRRLAMILASYTVYLDLWVTDLNGIVIANGRPQRFRASGLDVSDQDWFKRALKTTSGGEYVACDVSENRALGGATVATYAAAVRAGGNEHGEVIGTLGIFFDFAPQARDIVTGVRLHEEERERTRVLLIDSGHRVLAASRGGGELRERIDMSGAGGETSGYYTRPDGAVVGFSLTPGYETYAGLGWYGMIMQSPPKDPPRPAATGGDPGLRTRVGGGRARAGTGLGSASAGRLRSQR
jgi:hypothetical protein